MGESRVSSGSDCLSACGEGLWLSMWMEGSSSKGMISVRGKVGNGMVGCGEGGGVVRVRVPRSMASSMICTVVRLGDVGVNMVVVKKRVMGYFGDLSLPLYIFWCSFSHRM